ncbi:dehydrodolichyl diphosphate synthase subunit isoform X2 [Rhodnius prolixus]|uniref:dehydrodolichyl diphosphate synthase subunit isoform X2 n=1 Tax=Rhodnius prolixus TaxID=13249 RepID=UPI003D18FB88
MSWIKESNLGWLHLLCLRVLKCGRIPKHVAFIMDGNRRFAKKKNVEKMEGHTKGIENFKRSKEEVDDLMELTKEKFKRLLEERDKLMEYGLRIRVIGNMGYLPEDIVKIVAEAECMTKENNKTLLNVAFSYTAQDEITSAVNLTLLGLNNGALNDGDINLNLLSKCLHTQNSPFPELIIRTSGETRLSDFLLWQGSCSYLHFTGVLWPELTLWHFLWAIFKFQCVCKDLDNVRNKLLAFPALSSNGSAFIDGIDTYRLDVIKKALAS